MYAFVYTSLIIAFMISIFVSSSSLHYGLGAIAIVALLLASLKTRGLYLYTGLVFLLSGIALFLYNGLPAGQFLLQFESMLGLLSFFLVLPFINWLIFVGRFAKTIKQLLQMKMKSWNQLYERGSIASHLLGNFLNITTIPVIEKSLSPLLKSLSLPHVQSFCSRAILRAYALSLSWSATEVLVSSSIDITGASYLAVFPIMLGLAVLSLVVDGKLAAFRYRNMPFTADDESGHFDGRKIKRKILELALFLLFFIGIVSAVQFFVHISFLLTVVIVLPPYSIVWSFALKKTRRYFRLLMNNWNTHVTGLSKYFFMFLSAGLFVQMLSQTGWLLMLEDFYYGYIDQPILFYLLTAAFFLLTSVVGFHPLVAITLFAEIIRPMMNELSAVPFTVVLIVSSLCTVMYSPFNLSVSLMSSELKINPYRITGWNIGFAMLYVLMGIGTAAALDYVFFR